MLEHQSDRCLSRHLQTLININVLFRRQISTIPWERQCFRDSQTPCSAVAVCLEKKPSPCMGWEGARPWEHVQGHRGGGGTRLGGRQLCPGACCLPFPARHRIALRARLFCTALEPTQPRHGAIARLAKGCLGHGGARGGERDVFLKDRGKELCPAARCETSAGWPGAGRGY